VGELVGEGEGFVASGLGGVVGEDGDFFGEGFGLGASLVAGRVFPKIDANGSNAGGFQIVVGGGGISGKL